MSFIRNHLITKETYCKVIIVCTGAGFLDGLRTSYNLNLPIYKQVFTMTGGGLASAASGCVLGISSPVWIPFLIIKIVKNI